MVNIYDQNVKKINGGIGGSFSPKIYKDIVHHKSLKKYLNDLCNYIYIIEYSNDCFAKLYFLKYFEIYQNVLNFNTYIEYNNNNIENDYVQQNICSVQHSLKSAEIIKKYIDYCYKNEYKYLIFVNFEANDNYLHGHYLKNIISDVKIYHEILKNINSKINIIQVSFNISIHKTASTDNSYLAYLKLLYDKTYLYENYKKIFYTYEDDKVKDHDFIIMQFPHDIIENMKKYNLIENIEKLFFTDAEYSYIHFNIVPNKEKPILTIKSFDDIYDYKEIEKNIIDNHKNDAKDMVSSLSEEDLNYIYGDAHELVLKNKLLPNIDERYQKANEMYNLLINDKSDVKEHINIFDAEKYINYASCSDGFAVTIAN